MGILPSKKVTKSSAVREDGEGGGSILRKKEKPYQQNSKSLTENKTYL